MCIKCVCFFSMPICAIDNYLEHIDMCNKFVAINGSMLMFIEQKSLTNENNNTQDICDGGQFTARSLSYLPN